MAKFSIDKENVVNYRKKGLIRFVTKCLSHPRLKKAPELLDFLGNKINDHDEIEIIEDIGHEERGVFGKFYSLVAKSLFEETPRETTPEDRTILNYNVTIKTTLDTLRNLQTELQNLHSSNDKKLELVSGFLNSMQNRKISFIF